MHASLCFNMKLLIVILFIGLATAAPPKDRGPLTGKANPDEEGPYFQGDIMIAPGQERNTRNGKIDTRYRWPDPGAIPFYLNSGFTSSQIQQIERAVADYASSSKCVRLQQITSTSGVRDYISVVKSSSGCSSYVGRIGGSQTLKLSSSCINAYGSILHEFLHALGFYHMQSNHNRDSWVTVMWENITPGYEHNFNKYDSNTVTDYGVTYDYGSVMHYSAYGFSSNGEPTLVPHYTSLDGIGQRAGFSSRDIEKLDAMYC